MSKIHQSLENLFSQHRIVLWYDAERAFTEEYEALESDGIEKLIVDGNEFRRIFGKQGVQYTKAII